MRHTLAVTALATRSHSGSDDSNAHVVHTRRGRLPVSPFLGARQSARASDRASPLQEWATLVARRRCARAHAHAQAHASRTARSVAVPRTPDPGLHSFSVPPASQELLSSVRLRAPSSGLCTRSRQRGFWAPQRGGGPPRWNRGAWRRPGSPNANEGCGARWRRRQPSEWRTAPAKSAAAAR